jgi:hypothetical protein
MMHAFYLENPALFSESNKNATRNSYGDAKGVDPGTPLFYTRSESTNGRVY